MHQCNGHLKQDSKAKRWQENVVMIARLDKPVQLVCLLTCAHLGVYAHTVASPPAWHAAPGWLLPVLSLSLARSLALSLSLLLQTFTAFPKLDFSK